MTTLKQIFGRSVFRPIPRGAVMNDILAALFHRSAATLYLTYSLWAIISIWVGIPSLIQNFGQGIGQYTFPILVLFTAAPSCFGATFWPNLARLELFSGSAFCMTLVFYLATLGYQAMVGEASWSGFTLLLSILVVPIARTVIVVIFLLRQADERRMLEGDI